MACLIMTAGLIAVAASGAEEKEQRITAHIPGSIYEETPTNLLVIVSDQDGEPVIDERVYIYMKEEEKRTALFHGDTDESGMLSSTISIPKMESTSSIIEIATEDRSVEGNVKIIRAVNVLISTDKPLYQPGQTVNIRTLSLSGKDPTPTQEPLRIEIRDADSNLIFRKDLTPNEFGVSDTSMPLSDQLNMGVYTIKVISMEKEFTKEITVQNYVLPKFNIELKDVDEWYLIGEPIEGNLTVNYFFGKPVEGTVSIEVLTYYGEWDVIDHLEGTLYQGSFHFKLDGPDYAVGLPLGQNNGLVELDVTVTDTAGHEELDSSMISVSKEPIMLSVVTDSNVPGATSKYYFIAKYGNGQPVDDADVKITFNNTIREKKTDVRGIAPFEFLYWGMNEITVNVTKGSDSIEKVLLLSDTEGLKITSEEASYEIGDTAGFDIHYKGDTMTDWVYYDVVSNGFAVRTGRLKLEGGRAGISFPVTKDMYPLAYVRAYKTRSDLNIIRDVTIIGVKSSDEMSVEIESSPEKDTYEPYSDLDLTFRVKKNGVSTVSALGVSIVDESVFEMSERITGMDKTVFGLEEEFSKPSVQVLGYVFGNYGSGGPVQDMPDVIFEESEDEELIVVSDIRAQTRSTSQKFDEVSGYLIGGFILLGAGLLLIVLSAVKDSRKGVGVGFGIVALAGILMIVF
ncbi:MAG: MG2 domain-containing protein, partial [Candidatus Thermoplasmatota archaeon]|nr:MG2 domain-containing protein [Candidatus Thermoplasmatota archaeon]